MLNSDNLNRCSGRFPSHIISVFSPPAINFNCFHVRFIIYAFCVCIYFYSIKLFPTPRCTRSGRCSATRGCSPRRSRRSPWPRGTAGCGTPAWSRSSGPGMTVLNILDCFVQYLVVVGLAVCPVSPLHGGVQVWPHPGAGVVLVMSLLQHVGHLMDNIILSTATPRWLLPASTSCAPPPRSGSAACPSASSWHLAHGTWCGD